ncbi:MAG TPA: hypothetical protein VIW68_12715 [Candidatus Sulfotelmatobacter sp.]
MTRAADGSIVPITRPAGSLAPATLDAANAAPTPTLAPGTPMLKPATLTPPDPNDPRYQLHGGKRVLTGIMGALSGMGGHLDAARALNPYQRAMDAYNKNVAAQKEQASIQDVQSQTAEREAQGRRADAEANRVTPDKTTPEEQTIHDLMTGENGSPRVNSATNKPYTYLEAYRDVKQAGEKPATTPEADKQLSDSQISQFNAGLGDRYKVLNPNKALPPEYTLGKGATQKDFDRVDKLLTGTETAAGTKATRDSTENDKKVARDQKTQADRDKYVQPYQAAVDNAQAADDYVKGGKFTGPDDYALMNQFQEMIVSGQKAGIRFTKNEQDMLRGAQSTLNSIKAGAKHVVSGSYFSDDERKQIVNTMKGIATRSQKSIDDYDAERGGGGSSVDALVKKYGGH